ncbi:sensor histidine kinase YesM [Clostridia bacterium]|nr:sensor histidine kinase YesM [Clostridia bacterium]
MRAAGHLKNLLYSMSFRNKLILVLVFSVIVPTLVVEIAITARMRDNVLRRNTDMAISSAIKTEQQIQEIFKQVVDVSNMLYVDERLTKIISSRYISSWAVVNAMKNYNGFTYYLNYYPQIKDIRFYISTSNLFGDYNYIRTTRSIDKYPWYKDTMAQQGLVCWNYTFAEEESQAQLSLTRLIRDSWGADVGVLVIDLDKNYMSQFLNHRDFQILLTNKDGLVLAAGDEEYLNKGLADIGYVRQDSIKSPDVFECAMNGEDSVSTVTSFRIKMFDEELSILSIFPQRRIVEDTNNEIFWYLFIIVVGALVAAFLVILFTDRMSNRIQVLSDEIHSIATGNLKTEITVSGGDEIGRLSADVQTMAESLSEFIDVAYVSELQKKQTELIQKESRYRMLINQLNPHFLFNALETIRMKAQMDQNYEVSKYVKVLGKILRLSLKNTEGFITLSNEMDFVTNYLTFQMFRFQDKLEYRIDLGDVDPDTTIIPYLIQPVVENCVIHGIEPQKGKGLVRVRAEEIHGDIYITVEDNGLGIDERRQEEIWKTISAEEPEGGSRSIGLRNVYQRIRIYYGEKYGLSIHSGGNGGTKVVIHIPVNGVNGRINLKADRQNSVNLP